MQSRSYLSKSHFTQSSDDTMAGRSKRVTTASSRIQARISMALPRSSSWIADTMFAKTATRSARSFAFQSWNFNMRAPSQDASTMPAGYAEERNRVFHNSAAPRDSVSMKKTKIVIAGGGFAGLYAAKYLDKRLARRPDVEVTLISRENFILFTPMLHEVAAGDLSPGDVVNPLRRILRHVNVVQAEVKSIDLSAKKIRCAAGIRNLELEF